MLNSIRVTFILMLLVSFFSLASEPLLLECDIGKTNYPNLNDASDPFITPETKFFIKESKKIKEFELVTLEKFKPLNGAYVKSIDSLDGKLRMGLFSSLNFVYYIEEYEEYYLLINESRYQTAGNPITNAYRYIKINRLNGKFEILTHGNKINGGGTCRKQEKPKVLF